MQVGAPGSPWGHAFFRRQCLEDEGRRGRAAPPCLPVL